MELWQCSEINSFSSQIEINNENSNGFVWHQFKSEHESEVNSPAVCKTEPDDSTCSWFDGSPNGVSGFNFSQFQSTNGSAAGDAEKLILALPADRSLAETSRKQTARRSKGKRRSVLHHFDGDDDDVKHREERERDDERYCKARDGDTRCFDSIIYQCWDCGNVFTTRDKLDCHRQLTHDNDAGQLNVDRAVAESAAVVNLLEHLPSRRQQSAADVVDNKPDIELCLHQFKCASCSAVFREEFMLRLHESVHTRPLLKSRPRPHGCLDCGKRYSSLSMLECHKMLAHTEGGVVGSASDSLVATKYKSSASVLEQRRFYLRQYFKKLSPVKKQAYRDADNARKLLHRTGRQSKFSGTTIASWPRVPATPKPSSRTSSNATARWRGRYPCTICSKVYTTLPGFKYHMAAAHLDERNFKCDICEKRFISRSLWKAHAMWCRPAANESNADDKCNGNNTKHYPFKCSKCDKAYTSIVGLKYHIKTVHLQLRRPAAATVAVDVDQFPYVCQDCMRCFETAAALLLHAPTFCVKQHSCYLCSSAFRTSSHLRRHLITAHSDERPFACEKCGNTFKTDADRRLHVRTVHASARPHVCGACGKSFKSARNLQLHSNVHRTDRVRPHACAVCDRRFMYSSALTIHMRIHTGEKPFVCKHCGKAFVSTVGLRQHEVTHLEERPKPFSCEHCGKAFAYRQVLRDHVRRHTGEKPHQCPSCSRRFTQRTHMMEHYKTVHSVDKPYVCEDCGQSFSLIKRLRQHQLSHDVSGRFTCTDCHKSYVKMDSLKEHRKIHSSDGCHICQECGKAFFHRYTMELHLKRHAANKLKELRSGNSSENVDTAVAAAAAAAAVDSLSPDVTANAKTGKSQRTVRNREGPPDRFHCTQCSKPFARDRDRRNHEKRKHSSEKPFACSFCGKSFALLSSLTSHKKRHTAQLLPCTECGKGLPSRHELQRHLYRHQLAKQKTAEADSRRRGKVEPVDGAVEELN